MSTNDYRGRACDCLSNAEKELQDLLSKAAKDGDYNAIMDLSRAAQELAHLKGAVVTGVKEPNSTALYPKFYRKGDRLVLRGKRRRRANAEYEHECPKVVLDKLVTALLKAKVRPITPMDSIWPQLTGYARYQPRICLRWMRSLALIKKHGHKGYEVLDPEHFESNAQIHWERLPEL